MLSDCTGICEYAVSPTVNKTALQPPYPPRKEEHLRPVDKSVYANTAQFCDCQLSAIDWIRSPFDVPMPTHSDRSPDDPVGALGRISVDVASRMNEPDATGPVLKAGPMAASAVATAVARAARRWRGEGIVVVMGWCEGGWVVREVVVAVVPYDTFILFVCLLTPALLHP